MSSSAGGAYWASMPPSCRTAMRSPILIASSMSWVTNTTVLRSSRLQAQELVLEALAVDRVDRAERLVHQHQRRVGGERAGDADALALAAGELRRVAAAHLRRQPDQVEQLARRASACGACPSPAAAGRWRCCRRSSGAGTGRSAGSRSRSWRRSSVSSRLAHAAAADQDVALGDVDHAVDHPHRGRLAAAGRPDEHADLARRRPRGSGGRPPAGRRRDSVLVASSNSSEAA